MSEPFRILTVCTGNICRSPAAEFLLRRGLGAGVVVESAGVAALVDRPVDPQMAERLRAGGVDTDGFRARYLTPELIERADLVLAMTRDHRAEVVTAVPRALGRTFTLTEYAAALEQWTEGGQTQPFYTLRVPDRLAEFTAIAAQRRGTIRFTDPDQYDVPDPFRAAPGVYDEALRRIGAAVDSIVGRLRGLEPVAGPDSADRGMSEVWGGASAAGPGPGQDRSGPVAERPWGQGAAGEGSDEGGLRRLFRRRRP
ncbi:low molecular weight phosphatase family protein [Raineyella fluvialis]|uniref:Low molecular weight phosphatase family protein n=1 Tax=Raineyella fluvialis TaxID=2662261 RepID=A0A5Q2FGH0_9ACTN|nr:low molecular weight phosphatase family protein [Raineyella fluvialis]QGF24213.1 low molecular weight phosphatase family protein [Raineyella fluvialis]